ncbi:MAG: nucleotide sugar dehydrogenase [Desulfobacterales bacterium]|nr:nucleotide sugar dehydrogenase [Desulfobacterales bacterium]
MLTIESLDTRQDRIAVVGLGYVGLPLAVHLARHFDVVGFDLDADRVAELADGRDRTLEVTSEDLRAVDIRFSADAGALEECRLIIVAVPTPIDDSRIPDLGPLKGASGTVGDHIAAGSCVVFESTVYPGATEEVCVPIIEARSGLSLGSDFTVGYSPERINPGDKVHTLDRIVKVVSGSDPATTRLLADVYGRVVAAGIHEAPSIRVAEAAKVIENTQRDLNIALMNELAMIFDRMGIDTRDVLAAAGTKWNFLNFHPGLVGGHCIGVDPYYLTYKAESIGYHPDMIVAGRRINDGMGKYVAEKTVKLLIRGQRQVRGATVAVLGLTFKENVPDLRNTRVVDIVHELQDYGMNVLVHDPLADPEEARRYYGIHLVSRSHIHNADAAILAVGHEDYAQGGLAAMANMLNPAYRLLLDIKAVFDAGEAAKLGICYWRL